MIKSIKGIMSSSDGFEIFPIISLLIFFLFFVGLFWWVFGYKKESINEMNNIPFDDDDENNTLL